MKKISLPWKTIRFQPERKYSKGERNITSVTYTHPLTALGLMKNIGKWFVISLRLEAHLEPTLVLLPVWSHFSRLIDAKIELWPMEMIFLLGCERKRESESERADAIVHVPRDMLTNITRASYRQPEHLSNSSFPFKPSGKEVNTHFVLAELESEKQRD